MFTRARRYAAALLATALIAGCAQTPSTPTTGSSGGAFPVTVKASNGTVTIAAKPARIVSLSPTATEMLYAIGAGGEVKAVDDQSDFPANAPRTKLSGFKPNAEAVAGYKPDLVLIQNDTNGLLAALTRLKITVLVLPSATTLEASYAQTLALGTATGHLPQARQAVQAEKTKIAAAVSTAKDRGKGLKVYHEVDPTYFSATSRTFAGDIYKLFGMVNIADAAKATAPDYPQLSAEFVVRSAPDVIVLADTQCCAQSAAVVAKRPAFANVPAVRTNTIVAISDDIASRWGPRAADLAAAISTAIVNRKA
ncbi:helical backbone metal receptor [Fodinicola acaciae]|uniref:helical backbone metal receptor n=1 Tax=Fodinicola acaciae TaxID=2681555 RepID=UPI0013D87347|nr:helical backbone metal receptor [Fodinicola acaciae]